MTDGSSAQWSHGIDKILSFSAGLKSCVPRRVISLDSDSNSFSKHFTKSDAVIYISLFRQFLAPYLAAEAGTDGSLAVVDLIAKMFASASALTSSSEIEARANNATISELFAGIFRTIRDFRKDHSACPDPVQSVFVDFFVKNVEKLSLDFCSDWAEAIAFAYFQTPVKVDEKGQSDELFVNHLLESFRQVFASAASVATVAGGETEESFAKQGKILQFTKALLKAGNPKFALFFIICT